MKKKDFKESRRILKIGRYFKRFRLRDVQEKSYLDA